SLHARGVSRLEVRPSLTQERRHRIGFGPKALASVPPQQRSRPMTVFYHILGNNLVANITNFTVWFAITFWVYLETQSVFATGMIAGIYLIMTASSGIWFGSIVDHNSKRLVMLGSSVVSFAL